MERTKWNPAHLSKAQINPIDSEFLSRLGLPSLKNDELTYSPELLPDSIEGTDCHLIGIYGIWNDLPLYVRESTAGVWMIIYQKDGGTQGHTVTTATAGGFDGTNNTATFNAASETLVLLSVSSTRWAIVENIGSVGLTAV